MGSILTSLALGALIVYLPASDHAAPYLNNTHVQSASEYVIPRLKLARESVNTYLQPFEAWQIVFLTAGVVMILTELYRFVFQRESFKSRMLRGFFRFVRKLPFISEKIEEEVGKNRLSVQKSLLKPVEGEKINLVLPKVGIKPTQLTKDLKFLESMGHVDWRNGAVSGGIYHGGEEFTKLQVKAYAMFALSNPLHPDIFPGLRKMEAEVVSMVLSMFHGTPLCCGAMTSGGTESILMAVKAYRDRGYDNGITEPEIICPASAHAAFDKACQYFNIKMVSVPVDPITRVVRVKDMKSRINRNTILLVGSCPSFPHGVIDPIEELGALAVKYKLGLHVDCCLGSFLVAFMDKAGFPLAPFDFRVPGVSSISCDTHKYGFAVKGTSVIMYNSTKLRTYQYFIQPDWTGGIYASPSMAGSRPGGLIAATWAAMMLQGEEGYIEATHSIIKTARAIKERVATIPGLQVCGDPPVSVVAFCSKEFDIYRLSSAMHELGWNLNSLQFPPSIHICVTLLHTLDDTAERFMSDLASCTAEIMLSPKSKSTGSAAIYGMAQAIPDRSLVGEISAAFIDCLYAPEPLPVTA